MKTPNTYSISKAFHYLYKKHYFVSHLLFFINLIALLFITLGSPLQSSIYSNLETKTCVLSPGLPDNKQQSHWNGDFFLFHSEIIDRTSEVYWHATSTGFFYY